MWRCGTDYCVGRNIVADVATRDEAVQWLLARGATEVEQNGLGRLWADITRHGYASSVAWAEEVTAATTSAQSATPAD